MGFAMVKNLPSNSPAHLAGKISFYACRLRSALKKKDSRGAASLAIHLAQAVAMTHFKLDLEETLWRGIRFSQKGPKHGGANSAKRKIDDAKDSCEDFQRTAENVWREMLKSKPNRKWKASEVARRMVKEYPDIGNWNTIRRLIKQPKY